MQKMADFLLFFLQIPIQMSLLQSPFSDPSPPRLHLDLILLSGHLAFSYTALSTICNHTCNCGVTFQCLDCDIHEDREMVN